MGPPPPLPPLLDAPPPMLLPELLPELVDPPPAAAEAGVTVTCADADLVESAVETAVMVTVAGVGTVIGAV
jgi:hypothetical protein